MKFTEEQMQSFDMQKWYDLSGRKWRVSNAEGSMPKGILVGKGRKVLR